MLFRKYKVLPIFSLNLFKVFFLNTNQIKRNQPNEFERYFNKFLSYRQYFSREVG